MRIQSAFRVDSPMDVEWVLICMTTVTGHYANWPRAIKLIKIQRSNVLFAASSDLYNSLKYHTNLLVLKCHGDSCNINSPCNVVQNTVLRPYCGTSKDVYTNMMVQRDWQSIQYEIQLGWTEVIYYLFLLLSTAQSPLCDLSPSSCRLDGLEILDDWAYQ